MPNIALFPSYRGVLVKLSLLTGVHYLYLTPSFGANSALWTAKFGLWN